MSRRQTEKSPQHEVAEGRDAGDRSAAAPTAVEPGGPELDKTLGLLGHVRTLLAELRRRREGGSNVKSST